MTTSTELDDSFNPILKVLRAIPGSSRKRDPDNQWGKTGIFDIPCPKCGSTLHWARAVYNGHVRVWCDTRACFQLMS